MANLQPRSPEAGRSGSGERLWRWKGTGTPIVLVHGFTGDGLDFEALAASTPSADLWAVDLLGHGESPAPEASRVYQFDAYVDRLEALVRLVAETAGPPLLLGYSMGGRLALAACCRAPIPCAALILIGTHPGLRTESDRVARAAQDGALADRIEAQGVDAFLDYWRTTPPIASQRTLPEPYKTRLELRRGRNRAHALAATLRLAGTHAMPDLWYPASQLDLPVKLVTGQNDLKFGQLARDLAPRLQHGEHHVVPGGHAVHLESPAELASLLAPYEADQAVRPAVRDTDG